ncbi:MAG TPA: YhdP family protein [Ideonella sp.]|uniref:YhdP family protein n=1 Tax=Ideonella sp. TaxID=1929293 RepID=UPI002E36008C|nr:YhdP family protein [Ideonella sp.]HEX5682667.1 YhdP family protein [Ideonella sp.]
MLSRSTERVPLLRRLVSSLLPNNPSPAWHRPSRSRIGWLLGLSRFALRGAIVLMLTLWSIVLIAWLTLHWGILPYIDEWRPQIEQRASQAIGLPVKIGQISVKSSGWVPALELRDVVLSDREGRQALRLPRVSAALSPKSLFAWRLVLAQLYIENPELEVRRDPQGRLHVAGLNMDSSARLDSSTEGGGLDWLLSQPEFVLRHGTLRWVDQQRGAPPLELRDADLVLRNGLRRHEMRLDATPGAGLGERFMLSGRFSQPLLARSGDWARWSGTAYAQLPGVDLAKLRDYATLPFDLQSGAGSARLWLDLSKGHWRRATLDAALDNVALRLAPALEPLALQRLQGRIEAERHGGSLQLSGQQLAFTTAEGARWPASRFSLALTQQQRLSSPTLSDQPVAGGEFTADRLDLALMAGIAGRLPLPDSLRQGLAELAPTGVVQALQLSWVGAPAQPAHYRVKGRVGGLSIAALPAAQAASGPAHIGRPGWRGADLEIDANEAGGEAKLLVRRGALELPGLFEDPLLPVDHFSSRLVWRIQPQRPSAGAGAPPPLIDLRLLDGQFANADARGELQAHWRTGEGSGHGKGGRFPGVIDLTAQIDRGQATSVPRYMPVGLRHTREYLAGAILGGTVRHARLRLRGDLHEFPFAQGGGKGSDGEFVVTTQAENLTFAYVPPVLTEGVPRWPAFTEVNGELVFDRTAMRIRDARAKLWGIELKNVNGGIANLTHEPTLVIEGGGRGPLSDALRFVGATPIDTWLSHALREATGTGQADLQLALNIPLNDSHSTTVKGALTLGGNDVRVRPDVPLLGNAKTRIEFSQRGFAIAPGTARALGGDVSFEGGLAGDGVVRFAAQGTASAEGLRQAHELRLVPRLASAMTGQAPYKLQLGVTKGQTELLITSPLTGVALDLPAPLRKTAEASWPLRIQTQLLPAGAEAAVPRDRLHIELGTVFQADYERQLTPDGARVQRGAVALGEAALPPLPPSGVAAAAQLPQLNADAWWARVHTGLPEPRTAGAAATDARDPDVTGYLPNDLSLRTANLTLSGRRLGNLSLTLQRRGGSDAEAWHGTLQGDAAQGQIDYRPANAGAPWPSWKARLARLALPAAEGGTPSPGEVTAEAARTAANATTPPAIDLVVDELEWRGKKLGKLEFEGRPADGAAPRDWRLSRLNLASADSRLSGNGLWAAGRKRMTLELKLDMSDAGSMLERLGMGKQVRNGQGRVQGEFNWTGSALQPDWPSLGGAAQVNVDAGQFLKAEPGAARLLGVLSLQSLPRRLTLDFRDVFQQGFAFDNLAGDIALEHGVARSNNLRIRGLQAAVLIEGQTDLKHETQDLHMVVVPEINAGTASLAYAAINPAIGLGTFLAQLFLRKPLMQAGTREFHVGGTWADPQVQPIERLADRAVDRQGGHRPSDYPGGDLDAAASAPYPAR